MGAIYKRELESYFNTMTGYIFSAVVLCFIGIYFMVMNLINGYPYFSYVLYNTLIIFMVCTPILTMRCLAEEKRSKTDQLLFTYPVSITKVVLGKFFAMVTVYAIPLVISCLCPIIIAIKGDAFLLVDYGSIFAYLCMGCLFVAIGMFISSLTESQIIAAVVTFGVLLLLYLWESLCSFLPAGAGANLGGVIVIITVVALLLYAMSRNGLLSVIVEIVGVVAAIVVYLVNSDLYENLLSNALSGLSVAQVYYNFIIYSVFDLGGIFFYLSVAALFVFLTVQTLRKRRWS